MRNLYVGKSKNGNDVVYIETEYGAYRYHLEGKHFSDVSKSFDFLKKLFNLEMKRELKDGELVSDIVRCKVEVE